MRNTVMVDTYRGLPRVRSWPEPRRSRRSAAQREQEEWFRQANKAAKIVHSREQAAVRDATRGSPLQPRDLHIAAMAGRLWAIQLPAGSKIFPYAALKDVSDSLDTIEQRPGFILVRGDDDWKGQEFQSGGGAQWHWNLHYNAPPALSGSLFAFKGGIYQAADAFDISGLAAHFQGVSGGSYKMVLCALSSANVIEAITETPVLALDDGLRVPRIWTATASIAAGKRYALLVGRLDAGDTYAFPTYFDAPGMFTVPLSLITGGRLASVAPAVGMTVENAGGLVSTTPLAVRTGL